MTVLQNTPLQRRGEKPRPAARPDLQPGDVLHLGWTDFMGSAENPRNPRLLFRVTVVEVNLSEFPEMEWLTVYGAEVRQGSGQLGEPKALLVRVDALAEALVSPQKPRPA